jgi:hypothetical protein
MTAYFNSALNSFAPTFYQDSLLYKQIFITGKLSNKGNDSIWDCNISVMIRKLFIIGPDVGVDSSPIFNIMEIFLYIFSIYFFVDVSWHIILPMTSILKTCHCKLMNPFLLMEIADVLFKYTILIL